MKVKSVNVLSAGSSPNLCVGDFKLNFEFDTIVGSIGDFSKNKEKVFFRVYFKRVHLIIFHKPSHRIML